MFVSSSFGSNVARVLTRFDLRNSPQWKETVLDRNNMVEQIYRKMGKYVTEIYIVWLLGHFGTL